MIRRFARLLALGVVLSCALGFAPQGLGQAQVVSRTVLALYDGTQEPDPSLGPVHQLAEMPLNHLGYRVIYHDLAVGLPLPDVASVDFVITWFDRPVPDVPAYDRWARAAMARGVRFAVLGDPGDTGGPEGILAGLGLRIDGFEDLTYAARVSHMDRKVYGFEHGLDPVLPPFPLITITDPAVQSFLDLVTPKGTSALVSAGPRGGYVAPDYILYQDPEETEADPLNTPSARVKWLLDPLAYFRLVFDTASRPVPDVTTLSGRRIFFSQIDGDGWNNLSESPGPDGKSRRASRVILEDLLTRFPDLPVSVGVIAGDVDPKLGGDPQARLIARDLFALPQVEVAAHGYTHPFVWTYFLNYSQAAEQALVAAAPGSGASKPLAWLWSVLTRTFDPASGPAPYVATSASLPRSYLAYPFDLTQEIDGALNMASSLAPNGKAARLFLWTGDAMPFAQAIAMTRRSGVANLNGGDSRFDASLASMAYLAPIGRPVGAERQVYAPNVDETAYTNDWTGPYFGQVRLAETWSRTEAPNRLKPMDLYFHMFSGERRASVAVLASLMQQARAAGAIGLRTSHYARIAEGFDTTVITKTGPLRWQVTQRGALQTLRLDAPEGLAVDALQSLGVIGARRINGALYIALDASVAAATVALTRSQGDPGAVMLDQANWVLWDLRRQTCGWTYEAQGFGAGEATWADVAASQVRVVVRRGGAELWHGSLPVSDGTLRLALPVEAVEPVRVEVSCVGGPE